MNYYTVLGVESDAEFGALRKAYRARAMECHPDRFGGDPGKAEEFKLLVAAFNVLSDPLKRRTHDLQLGVSMDVGHGPSPAFDMGVYPEDEGAILDTLADDILEELIVGNVKPLDTTLQTLMLDLEQTEQFCLFREAKTCLYNGSTVMGEHLFRKYLGMSPTNILARYFLAKCCRANGSWQEAERELTIAIRIGSSRQPPLQLIRLRHELAKVRTSQPGLRGVLGRLFQRKLPEREALPADEAERMALNRSINRLAIERLRRPRARLPQSKDRGEE